MSLITVMEVQKRLAERTRERRLSLGWTQNELSNRSGVNLATYRKFEQKGFVSLESFLKILMALGHIEDIEKLLNKTAQPFDSIDDVLTKNTKPLRKRGRKGKSDFK